MFALLIILMAADPLQLPRQTEPVSEKELSKYYKAVAAGKLYPTAPVLWFGEKMKIGHVGRTFAIADIDKAPPHDLKWRKTRNDREALIDVYVYRLQSEIDKEKGIKRSANGNMLVKTGTFVVLFKGLGTGGKKPGEILKLPFDDGYKVTGTEKVDVDGKEQEVFVLEPFDLPELKVPMP